MSGEDNIPLQITPAAHSAHMPLCEGCEILALHKCGLLAIYKRPGVAVHPNKAKGGAVMLSADYDFRHERYCWAAPGAGGTSYLYLVNRLDSPTSGVVLASFTPDAAEAAKTAFELHKVKKVYYALCLGSRVSGSGKWVDRISESGGGNFVRGRVVKFGGRIASTFYRVERRGGRAIPLSLVRLMPETGLTHQLRIQCAQRKIPILGDATYGDFRANRRFRALSAMDRLFLHCAETSLQISVNGEKIAFSARAPMPDSFNRALDCDFKLGGACK